MKRIAIVTDSANSSLGLFIQENLMRIFDGYADSKIYSFAEMKAGDRIEEDVVLVMLPAKALAIKPYVKESRRVLVVQRTLQEEAVFKLLDIPAGSKVLVVNDAPETTLETVALLYQMGLDHLLLEPYLGENSTEEIQIAVTPGEAASVPQQIAKVIDLGHRCIDLSTFLQIMSRLGLEERELDRRLIQYGESIITLDTGIKRQYKELYLENTALDTVINLSAEGVMLMDREGQIRLCNASLRKMLELSSEDVLTLENLPSPVQNLLKQGEVRDEIVEWQGRSLLANKKELEQFGEAAGVYLYFQEVTYIRQLEQNLSKRLQSKGLLARYQFSDIVTESERMRQLIKQASMMADSDLTVLITGESGTGKELLAQSMHNQSPRRKMPFVAVNCAAVPEALLESELFGYEAGAFTGALKEGKAGLFEQAHQGTIFLDEIGDMPHALQARLLRVLQERQVMRVGAQRVMNVNIRVIAATNQNLMRKIEAGQFRADLYYRINVLPLMLPPLRERTEDISLLLRHFLQQHNRSELTLSAQAQELCARYSWPGNIRELANAAAYLSFSAENVIQSSALPHYIKAEDDFSAEEQFIQERCQLEKALEVSALLNERQGLDGGAGRKQIGQALKEQQVKISEGEVRRILSILAECGFVCSQVGRGGSRLTKKGELFLNRFVNR